MFHHLKIVKQTYLEHLYNAISYSFISCKASYFFFIHAIFPDLFEFNGSREIERLHNILIDKKDKFISK